MPENLRKTIGMKKIQVIFSVQPQHVYKKRCCCFVSVLLLFLTGCNSDASAQILWSNAVGQAWLTGTNWTGGTVPGSADIAQFGTAPTSGVTGIGINMNGATNNGLSNQSVGAIEVLAARPVGLYIGNSSSSTGGTLTLNGATVNGIDNVILRNNAASLFEITDFQAFNVTELMNVALNNITDNIINIDATGGGDDQFVNKRCVKKTYTGRIGQCNTEFKCSQYVHRLNHRIGKYIAAQQGRGKYPACNQRCFDQWHRYLQGEQQPDH
jgi:hypothetical protein